MAAPGAWAATFILAVAGSGSARAATLEPIGSATYGAPTFVTSDPRDPDRLFVTEQPGTIDVTTPAGTSLFLDLTDKVLDGGERGLWSMAFAPDFAQTGRFYVAYSADDSSLALDEYREAATPAGTEATRRPVLSIPTNAGTTNHNGGQLQFGRDGYLYWSTGEDNVPANAQTLANLLGKLLRIDPRESGGAPYRVPADNPFVGTAGAQPEIWALGLRNPWRFSFDRATGAVAIADVGSDAWEEVNYATQEAGGARGANYGWPSCQGASGSTCNGPDFTAPLYAYDHTPRASACAIMGGYVVRDPDLGDLFGRYLFTDLCGNDLRSIDPAAPPPFDTHRSEGLSVPGPVSFGEDACGRLYVVARGTGQVLRIEGPLGGVCPSDPTQPPPPTSPALPPTPAADLDPPQTGLILEPRNERGSRLTARLSSDEPGSSFECRLDGHDWKPCGAKRRLKHLESGRHRFRARATDAAGNTDPSAAKRRFRTRARDR